MKRYTIFLAVLMTSCTTPYDKGLKGVWQYVSGNYISENSTTNMTSDNVKSIKIYGDNHYSLVTQIVSSDIFFAHSGLYNLDGDSYTESFKIHKNSEMIGDSAIFKYQLINNQLIISDEFMKEIWEKIE